MWWNFHWEKQMHDIQNNLGQELEEDRLILEILFQFSPSKVW